MRGGGEGRGRRERRRGEETKGSPRQPDPPSGPCFLRLRVLLSPTLRSFVEGCRLASRPLTRHQGRNMTPTGSLPCRSQSPRLRKPPWPECRQQADTELRAPAFLLLLVGMVALPLGKAAHRVESHTQLTSPDDDKPRCKHRHCSPSFLQAPPCERDRRGPHPPADGRPAGRALTQDWLSSSAQTPRPLTILLCPDGALSSSTGQGSPRVLSSGRCAFSKSP